MAIIGIGTDIVEIERIREQRDRLGDKLAKRVLTLDELAIYAAVNMPERYLAKRFAAKEAAAKALGTGIGRGVSFQHIHISNDDNGAPLVNFTDGAALRLAQLGGCKGHISIADEKHYAIATVILES
ncbi:phosphopantethiene--protein transferase domain [Shewanella denitrificans OS217]|jgi:holo-[acyl-carrier protein] synthase|uniref:Holo-[acyl-carrier-protein] synthase n=1 Tax=Shewanella denitrificans (strain OS217 / ATCC BAA-1090 / DSM 15013) TaxID=318161 RepID=ACPS_SHEDO|nr:holo-ACP synthase [Shewanella denitrificans]Q12KI5.1 RecName: Full=Holo-[acyl-carrier-protein] synthase; Short=Holo-ACP synthase; AltName: Full=4'-phosphopantetheinyl transferase AcpS [Shewanella denitrificans OS217]ABE56041.1 phosphopantethiene--protein transferase domain [Shewanella denitrificans OS217]